MENYKSFKQTPVLVYEKNEILQIGSLKKNTNYAINKNDRNMTYSEAYIKYQETLCNTKGNVLCALDNIIRGNN